MNGADSDSCDIAIVGGGLADGLATLALARRRGAQPLADRAADRASLERL